MSNIIGVNAVRINIYEGYIWCMAPKVPFHQNVFGTSYDMYYYIYELIIPYYCSTNRKYMKDASGAGCPKHNVFRTSYDIYYYIYELIILYWGICSTNRKYTKDASGAGCPKHPFTKMYF